MRKRRPRYHESTRLNAYQVLITILVVAALTMFLLAFSDEELRKIGTQGIHTDSPYVNWVNQPWIWSIILGVLVMLVFFITQGGNPNEMESDSEEGTLHE